MINFIPYIVWVGLSLSMFVGSFVVLMDDTMPDDWSDNKKTEISMYTLISLGFGEIIGGFACGYIIDKYRLRKTVII